MGSAPLSSDLSFPGHRAAILAALERLVDIVAQLRHPETGCPWDLAQTPTSLIPYVIEEAYEVVDAIQGGETGAIAEELGDLLLQVVLQAQVASDDGDFDLATVATGIADKLVRRHPHIFGDAAGNAVRATADLGLANVDVLLGLSPKLTKYSRTLPPLMAASKISAKAAKAGFEWDTIDDLWDKFREELDEFRQALAHEPQENQQAELGDLLFTLVNLARWYDLDPSEALQSTNRRFIRRFERVEDAAEKPLNEYGIEALETLWQQAKAQLAEPQD